MDSTTTNDQADTGATTPESAAGETASPESLRQERDELQERLLRTAAEFDNYRKRTERERRELHEFIAADLIRDFLPVLDDLERALDATGDAGDNPDLAAFREGISLIHRQWLDALRKRGVEAMDVVGHPFDPEWHEAVAHEPADGRPDGEVIAEIRRGYRIGSKLLRAAMVRVAKA